MFEIKPLTEESIPYCRYLYSEAMANSLFSVPSSFASNFDEAVQQPNAYFRIGVEDERIIALLGFEQIRWQDRGALLMIAVAPEHRNQGKAKAMVEDFLKEGFDQLNLRKVTATCLEGSPSQKGLETLGFELEGILQEDKWKDGEYRDGLIYRTMNPRKE